MIESLDHITPGWCEAILRENGWLRRGQVCNLHLLRQAETSISFVANLKLEYSADAPRKAPRHLFLKLSKPGVGAQALESFRRELEFYRDLAPRKQGIPVVCSYAVLREKERACLVLEDISRNCSMLRKKDSKQAPAELVVDALAKVHAAWWDDPRLAKRMAKKTRTGFLQYLSGSASRYQDLHEAVGDLVRKDRWRVFETVLEKGPELILARLQRGQGLTLCHHDCHHKNYMIGSSNTGRSAAKSAYIVDWQVYSRWWGVQDIVKFHFYAKRKDLVGKDSLLRRYHSKLLEFGVENYSWRNLIYDCRLSVHDLFLHVLDRKKSRKALPFLTRAMRMYQELGCADVF